MRWIEEKTLFEPCSHSLIRCAEEGKILFESSKVPVLGLGIVRRRGGLKMKS